jgi:DNA-directed RNA polymerase specialized sigma24 family protein
VGFGWALTRCVTKGRLRRITQRAACITLYLDDHSHRDIASVLGLSETNVATKLHRLKQRLRQRLESRS